MYSLHNEGKSIIAERFIRTFKAKIYEKMTANQLHQKLVKKSICY